MPIKLMATVEIRSISRHLSLTLSEVCRRPGPLASWDQQNVKTTSTGIWCLVFMLMVPLRSKPLQVDLRLEQLSLKWMTLMSYRDWKSSVDIGRRVISAEGDRSRDQVMCASQPINWS